MTASLGWVECDGCGRGFASYDARAILDAIVGRCPGCGGNFALAATGAGQADATARDRGPERPSLFSRLVPPRS